MWHIDNIIMSILKMKKLRYRTINNLSWGQLTVVRCAKSISIPYLKVLITVSEILDSSRAFNFKNSNIL